MEDFEDLKIDDVFEFFASTRYVNSGVEKKFTVKEILGVESQEVLDYLIANNRDYITTCFSRMLRRFHYE